MYLSIPEHDRMDEEDVCFRCFERLSFGEAWTCRVCLEEIRAERARFATAKARLRSVGLLPDSAPCTQCGKETRGVDHIVPLTFGGTNEYTNLRPMCPPCNSKVLGYQGVVYGGFWGLDLAPLTPDARQPNRMVLDL